MNFVTQATVLGIIEHHDNVKEFTLFLEKERKYNPGSFVQLTLDLVTASDIWPDSRTFSIASWEKGHMKFIIEKKGYYTSRIFNELQVGCNCTIKYPFGDLFDRNALHEKHLFMAGGLGITPFIGLGRYFAENNLIENVNLFYSTKYKHNQLYFKEMKELFGNRLELFITREKAEECHNRRICLDDVLRVADIDTNIYICGSKEFNSSFNGQVSTSGYKKIHMDEWE